MTLMRRALTGATLALVACGKPDVSGIYVYSSDREVTMVQLVQTNDGKLAGRLQSNFIQTDGTVGSRAGPADGAVSGHDIVLNPTSALSGGVQATGTVDGGKMTLTGNGFTLNARRSDLAEYQAALAHLQELSAKQQQVVAQQHADQQAALARNAQNSELAAKAQQVSSAVAQIRSDANKLIDGASRSPDFGRMAAANTARVAQMLRVAPRLSSADRGQLEANANQVEADTNQIEANRSQYAFGLNALVDDAKSNALTIVNLCGRPTATQLVEPCSGANSAAQDFKVVMQRVHTTFTPYKAKVQSEIDRQSALIRQIGAMNGQ